jgi:two-component system response regulator
MRDVVCRREARGQPDGKWKESDVMRTATTPANTASAAVRTAEACCAPSNHFTLTRDERPITILLVDDDPDCRLLVRDAIAECKVSNCVHEVVNGQEALDFLQRVGRFSDAPRPGLIYMDIEMPVMDGMTALQRIRSIPRLREIPIVMMTGVCDEAQMEQAAELGANSYTLKPANAEQFLRTVLASTNYWLTIHQYPHHHWPAENCMV